MQPQARQGAAAGTEHPQSAGCGLGCIPEAQGWGPCGHPLGSRASAAWAGQS